jgi:iduronate 2-sulfatase
MTGLRPDSLKIYDLGTNFRTYNPDVVTLSQYFMQEGYQSESIGKIYHIWHGNHDDSLSWSIDPWNPWNDPLNIASVTREDTIDLHTSYPKVGDKRLAWYRSEVPDKNLNDTRITDHAIKRLKKLKDTPFFLGVGYLKPHLPFVAPQRFWDLYDSDDIDIPEKTAPEGSPSFALNNSGELLCCYYKFDSMPVSDHVAKNLIHGYYASVSYIDHEIGRLIHSLEELGLMDNTIIVIWGDHG